VAQLLGICGDTPEILSRMAEQCDLHKIAVTYGSEGSVLFTDGRLFQHDGVKTQVVDTVGAGDAFTAALTIGLLSQADPTEILEHANQVAAFVCSQPGGTPVLQETLRRVG
jgi:fructokinase